MKKEQGFSLIRFIILVFLFIFFGMLAVRIVPIYSQYYVVLNDMNRLNNLPPDVYHGDRLTVSRRLKKRLYKQLRMDDVDDQVTPDNIILKPLKEGYQVHVKYDSEAHFWKNIYIVVKFEKKVIIKKEKGD